MPSNAIAEKNKMNEPIIFAKSMKIIMKGYRLSYNGSHHGIWHFSQLGYNTLNQTLII
jgi:hypothetical protein